MFFFVYDKLKRKFVYRLVDCPVDLVGRSEGWEDVQEQGVLLIATPCLVGRSQLVLVALFNILK